MGDDEVSGAGDQQFDAIEPFRRKYRRAFDLMTPDDLDRIAAIAVPASYAKGQAINEPRHGQGGVFVVAEGAVVLRVRADGKIIQLYHRRRRGDLFRLGHPTGRHGPSAHACAVRNDTVVHSIAWRGIEVLIRELPMLGPAMLVLEDALLDDGDEYATELQTVDGSGRVLHALAIFADDAPDHVVRETRTEIAQEASVSRETVSRELARLGRQHLIEWTPEGGPFAVSDPALLYRLYRERQRA